MQLSFERNQVKMFKFATKIVIRLAEMESITPSVLATVRAIAVSHLDRVPLPLWPSILALLKLDTKSLNQEKIGELLCKKLLDTKEVQEFKHLVGFVERNVLPREILTFVIANMEGTNGEGEKIL